MGLNDSPTVRDRILGRVLAAGAVVCLFQLAMIDLGVSYRHAYDVLRNMESDGDVEITKDKTKRGHPLVITPGPKHEEGKHVIR